MTNKRDFWASNALYWQLLIAVVSTAAFVAWCEVWGGTTAVNAVLGANRSTIYATLTAVFGTLLGFALTSFSIMLGFANAPQLEIIRNSASYADIWNRYKAAVRELSLATLCGLVALIADRDNLSSRVPLYFLVCATMLSAFRMYSVILVLHRVTDIITNPANRPSPPQPVAVPAAVQPVPAALPAPEEAQPATDTPPDSQQTPESSPPPAPAAPPKAAAAQPKKRARGK